MDWPKCETCKGTRAVDVGGYKNINRCPACNGTGEAAELSEEQAGGYIVEFYQGCQIVLECKVGGVWYVGVFIMKELKATGQGYSIKAALNAAAQAVKERGKE